MHETPDALTLLLQGLRLQARLDYVGGVCGRWAVDHNWDTGIWFHLFTKGRGYAHSPTWSSPLPLEQGDLLLFLPHAPEHYLSHSPDEVVLGEASGSKVPIEAGTAGLVCGRIELHAPSDPIWQAFPAEIVIRRDEAGDALSRLIELIVAEARAPGLASQALIELLLDGCFLLILRHSVATGRARAGVFAALQDPRLAAVLALIHSAPAQPWTLATLAERAGMSRTVLKQRFADLVGSPPVEYLTAVRMQLARRYLLDVRASTEQVAERCGYDSVSAFARAFKRHSGESPGAFRRRRRV